MDPTRRRLLGERERLAERLTTLTGTVREFVQASRDTNADDEHDPEGATIAFERSQAVALADQVRRRLGELDAALARLDDGTYGVCERCGRPLAVERLAARPAARTCVSC